MKPTDVIRRPLVTEKTTMARETGEVVVFEVALRATKIDVRRAVEKLFGTKVASVRTQIGHGKFKRQGRFEGQRPDRKKAWVRLKAGEKAPDFIEGT
jgi:large subunit ribosomal protein L23